MNRAMKNIWKAIKELEGEGFPPELVEQLWMEYNERLALSAEESQPGEWDKMYAVPQTQPKMGDHVALGYALLPHMLWQGYHYAPSPGQRKWLRETHGVTLGRTIVVDWVQVWDGTAHPRAFKFTSELHIDPKNRGKLVVSGVVSAPGRFFFESSQMDKEGKGDGVAGLDKGKAKKASGPRKARTLDEIMADLEGEV